MTGRLQGDAARVVGDALADQGEGLLRLRVGVGDPDQARRVHGADADTEDAAEAALGERLLVEDLDLEAVLLAGGLGGGGERGRGQVVRRLVDQVAGAVDLLGDGLGALGGGLVGLVARLGTEQGHLGEGLLRVGVLLVRGVGVRAEQGALGDGGGVLGGEDRQRERGLLRAGQGAGGGAGGATQGLGVEGLAVLGGGAQADGQDDGGLETGGGGQLRRLTFGTRGAQGLQDGGEPAVEGLVDGLGARGDDQRLPGLREPDDEGVGAQSRRAGSAESESSHGGEISLPLSSVAVEGWADRARRIVFRPGERRERAYARSPGSLTAAVIHSSVVSLSCLPFRLGRLLHTRLSRARTTLSSLHHLHHLHRSPAPRRARRDLPRGDTT
ncbi:hypothetical protein STANM309S_05989 [Streptomyces tanashiensis]